MTSFARGDRVLVKRAYGSWSSGTVVNTFTTDSNVRVQLDDTHARIVFAVDDVAPFGLVVAS